MKRTSELMAGSAMTVFKVSIVVWLLSLSQLNFAFTSVRIAVPAIMATALVMYYVNYFMMRRGAPLPLFIIAQPLMAALGVYVFVRGVTMEPALSMRPVMVNGAVYAAMLLSSGYTAYESPRQSGLLISFDVTAVMLVLLMAVDRAAQRRSGSPAGARAAWPLNSTAWILSPLVVKVTVVIRPSLW